MLKKNYQAVFWVILTVGQTYNVWWYSSQNLSVEMKHLGILLFYTYTIILIF